MKKWTFSSTSKAFYNYNGNNLKCTYMWSRVLFDIPTRRDVAAGFSSVIKYERFPRESLYHSLNI